MTETAVAGDDRDREIAALRDEVAALREVVELLRVTNLDSCVPSAWQQAMYPPTVGATVTVKPWTNWCAGAGVPPVIMNYVVDAAGPFNAPLTVHGAAGGYAGQVYQVPMP